MKKKTIRIVAIAAALVLTAAIATTVAVILTSQCQHAYDNACDGTCNECGESRAVSHSWKDADCVSPKTCTICGATEGDALTHDWLEATCTAPKTCRVCGRTEGTALRHTPEADDGSCTTEVKCAVCGEVTTGAKTEHIPHADDGDCTTPVTCTQCQTVLTAASKHDFTGNYESDEAQHWHLCRNEGCNASDEKAAHTPNQAAPTTSAPKMCVDCGYIMEPQLPHEHAYTLAGYDENEHFLKCACGTRDESTVTPHTAEDDDGSCLTERKCTGCDYVVVAAKNHEAGDDDGDCTTAVLCKNCDQIAVSAHTAHSYGATTYTWAPAYSACTATRSCTANGCNHTEAETKAATQDGPIFTVDFDHEAFETQTIDTRIQIGDVTVNPWDEVPPIDAGEAEEQ